MQLIKYLLQIAFVLIVQVSCWSQSDTISYEKAVVRAWAKCEMEIRLDSLDYDVSVTHFQINKAGKNLQIEFLQELFNNPNQEKHFRSVVGCLNEKYADTFPESVVILHFFKRFGGSWGSSFEADQKIIAEYKEREGLGNEVILIKAGISDPIR